MLEQVRCLTSFCFSFISLVRVFMLVRLWYSPFAKGTRSLLVKNSEKYSILFSLFKLMKGQNFLVVIIESPKTLLIDGESHQHLSLLQGMVSVLVCWQSLYFFSFQMDWWLVSVTATTFGECAALFYK